MGFNTVAVIYNDFTHELAKDGRYGSRIANAIRAMPSDDPSERSFGAGMVISQAHADHEQVTIVGRNSGVAAEDAKDLGWAALQQMAECLERHGYKVTKPKKVATPEAIHPRSVHAAYHEWKLRNGRDFPLNAAVVIAAIADAQRAHPPGQRRREAIQAGMKAASGIEAPSGRQDAPAA